MDSIRTSITPTSDSSLSSDNNRSKRFKHAKKSKITFSEDAGRKAEPELKTIEEINEQVEDQNGPDQSAHNPFAGKSVDILSSLKTRQKANSVDATT